MTCIDIARKHIGEKETNGPNRSPFIDSLCQEFDVPLGSSWCALFVSHNIKASGAGSAFPYGASSQAIRRWAEENGRFSRNPDDLLKWKGALGGFTNQNDSSHGHIFHVEKRLTDLHGHVVAVETIEGNTNDGGSANGDGCYERKRPCGMSLWYVNLTGIPGCEYW